MHLWMNKKGGLFCSLNISSLSRNIWPSIVTFNQQITLWDGSDLVRPKRLRCRFHTVCIRFVTNTHSHRKFSTRSNWPRNQHIKVIPWTPEHMSAGDLCKHFPPQVFMQHWDSLKDTYTGPLFSLMIKHSGKCLLGHPKYLFIGLYLPLSS